MTFRLVILIRTFRLTFSSIHYLLLPTLLSVVLKHSYYLQVISFALTMLNDMEFAFHYTWTCIHNGADYPIIRIKVDELMSISLILSDGTLQHLDYGSPKWIEIVLLFQRQDFPVPKFGGLRTIIKFRQLKKTLLNAYQAV